MNWNFWKSPWEVRYHALNESTAAALKESQAGLRTALADWNKLRDTERAAHLDQVEALCAERDAALARALRAERLPESFTDAEWRERLATLKRRVAQLAGDDPLWADLIALIDCNISTETRVSVSAAMGNEEAHRFRGRIGMLLDLRQQLADLPAQARAEQAQSVAG